MRSLTCLLLAPLLVACRSPGGDDAKAERPPPFQPRFEKFKTLYEVQDSDTGHRLGFVEKTTYDDGSVVYWVTGRDREMRHGYILGNGAAYRYARIGSRRMDQAEFLGADTFSAGARRILRGDQPVKLVEISIEQLMREREKAREASTTSGAEPEEGASEEE